MKGWIKLHRQFLDHWLCDEFRPLTKREAWENMLFWANYEDEKFLIKGQLITCKRGQICYSLETWAKKLNWTTGQVRNFFKLLQKDNMIIVEGLKYTTRLTICNYDNYQDQQQTDNKLTTFSQQTDNKLTTTSKEYKNKRNKEYKNILLSKIKISDFQELNNDYLEIAKSFQMLFKKNLDEKKISSTKIDNMKGSSIDDIRLLIEVDKFSIDDCRTVFTFLQKDEFWKVNIQCTKKLREKFQQLLAKARSKNGQQSTSMDDYKQKVANDLLNYGN